MGSQGVILSIVAPVYNEEKNIEEVVTYWNKVLINSRLTGEIVVTNDGSTDRTGEILSRLENELANLLVINKEHGGYGRALATSISASKGKYVMTIDSDGQFDAGEYHLLLTKLEEEHLSVVTGCRRGKKDSLFKVVADRVLNLIIRILFGLRLKDTNCALKLGKGEILRKIAIEATGYATPTEIVIKLAALGASLGEVEVSHLPRAGGVSKLRPIKTGIDMLKFLLYLKLKLHLSKSKVIAEI